MQQRARRGDQPVFAGCRGKFNEAAAQHESAVDVLADQPVVHQRLGQAVHGGPGNLGQGNQLGQGSWSGLEGIEDEGCFVDDANAT